MNLKPKLTLKVLLLLSLNYFSLSDAKTKYNVSLAELTTCREYDLHGTGYIYSDFFLVHSLENNKISQGERLHLKFYVMTSQDAHILLSVNDRPRLMDRVYEVVIGAGGDTFSTIRTSMGRRRVATNQQDRQLLSIFDPTPIEIVQMQDGNILVFIPGYKEEPLLNFTDASPLNINYISFSTFGSTSARWFYDCPFDGFGAELEQELRPLTPQQRLIANITAKAANRTMPELLQKISFAFQIRSVCFKYDESVLHTRLNLILYWNDPKLQWESNDFDGIEAIVRPPLDIWLPDISVFNAVFDTLIYNHAIAQTKIHANGSVVFLVTDIELRTWCTNTARNWPHDKIRCEIILGFDDLSATDHGPLLLEYDSSKPLSQELVSTLSEWRFVDLTISRIANGIVSRFSDQGVRKTIEGDVSLEFTIVQNSNFYKNVCTVPVLACQTLIILSFLLRGYRRGALILVVVLVMSMGLMFITKHAPPSYVPRIMIAYQHVMRISTFCYLLHVIVMWLELYPPTAKPKALIMSIVNSTPLRLVLCMRFSDSTEYVDIQSHPWREIAKILNTLSFIAINVFFIVTDMVLLPNF